MDGDDSRRVEVLGPGDAPEVVTVLCESFRDYPVMRFVLEEDGRYRERLRKLVTFFVMARVFRDEVLMGIPGSAGLRAAALVSFPGAAQSPPELAELREELWAELGEGPRRRYEAFGSATARFEVEAPHIHLNMIGVRPAAQGRGLGRELMEAVHGLSASRERSTGVTLTTELESNVPLYEHFGYELVGRTEVDPSLTTWGFFRKDR